MAPISSPDLASASLTPRSVKHFAARRGKIFKRGWKPRSVDPALEIPKDSEQDDNQYDRPKRARRPIAPISAIAPAWISAEGEDHQDDDKKERERGEDHALLSNKSKERRLGSLRSHLLADRSAYSLEIKDRAAGRWHNA